MATMLDVSIRAGVSKATVSRVLNGTGQVKESTRQQVFKAMEELGYRPNFLARSLANRTSNSIGLVVSTFDGFYFGRLLQQASRQTEAWGKQLIVTDGHWATRLRYQQKRLQRQLMAFDEFASLTRIQFKVQPPTVQQGAVGHTMDLSANAAETIQATADGISDPGLRAALERLAAHAKPKA